MNIEIEAPWLQAKVDQRIEFMVRHGALDIARENGTRFVTSYLDEGEEEMTKEERERWERTCDSCGRYVPPEPGADREDYDNFYTGYTARTVEDVKIMLAFGVCGTCKNLSERKTDE